MIVHKRTNLANKFVEVEATQTSTPLFIALDTVCRLFYASQRVIHIVRGARISRSVYVHAVDPVGTERLPARGTRAFNVDQASTSE